MAAKVLNDFQVKLVKQLPMDAIFISSLQARGFFSGNKLNTMNSKPTPADKVLYLLNDIMGSSVEFYIEKLLDAMEEYDKADNPPGVISQLALEMRSKMPDVMKTDVTKTDVTKTPVEPKKVTKPELTKVFSTVVKWKLLATFLIDDPVGAKAEQIEKNEKGNVQDCLDALINEYLTNGDRTWKRVLSALRESGYKNLADDTEKSLK